MRTVLISNGRISRRIPSSEIVTVDKEIAVSLYNHPNGTVIFTRPASRWGYTLARLRREGNWDLIAMGSGPYLVGWTPSRPEIKELKESKVFGVGGYR